MRTAKKIFLFLVVFAVMAAALFSATAVASDDDNGPVVIQKEKIAELIELAIAKGKCHENPAPSFSQMMCFLEKKGVVNSETESIMYFTVYWNFSESGIAIRMVAAIGGWDVATEHNGQPAVAVTQVRWEYDFSESNEAADGNFHDVYLVEINGSPQDEGRKWEKVEANDALRRWLNNFLEEMLHEAKKIKPKEVPA